MQKLKPASLSDSFRKSKLYNSLFPTGKTSDLIPFKFVSDGLLSDGGVGLYRILELNPIAFSKLRPAEQNEVISRFQQFLKIAPDDLQFKIVTSKMNVSSIVKPLSELADQEECSSLKVLREDNIQGIQRTVSIESNVTRYYLIIRHTPGDDDEVLNLETVKAQMDDEVVKLDRALRECGNSVITHEDETAFVKDFLFRLNNRYSSKFETWKDREERVKKDLSMIAFQRGESMEGIEAPLSCVVCPRSVDPHDTNLEADSTFYSYILVPGNEYPNVVSAGWLNPLFSPHCDVDIFLFKGDSQQKMEQLKRQDARSTAATEDAKNFTRTQDLEHVIQSARWMMADLSAGNEYYDSVIILTVTASSLKELKGYQSGVLDQLKAANIYGEVITSDVLDYYKATMPNLSLDDRIISSRGRNMTTSGASAFYPLDNQMLRDNGGSVIGVAVNGSSTALFNQFDTSRYENANMAIVGVSGSGKTFFSLMLALRQRIAGTAMFFILPLKAHEYKRAILAMGGEYVSFTGNSDVHINIMEIRPEAELSEKERIEKGVINRSKLTDKITDILTFFSLLYDKPTDLNAVMQAEIRTELAKLYQKFGITTDNKTLKKPDGTVKECPTLKDFYEQISDNEILKSLRVVLKPYTEGAKSNFSMPTNFDLDNKIVAFDVENDDTKEMVINLFLALTLCYSKVKEDTSTKSVIFIDEAWKFLSPDNAFALAYTDSLARLIRGYAGSLCLATQNLNEFAKSEKGQDIFANIRSKFVLRLGDSEYETAQTMFRITEDEVKRIQRNAKGTLTLIANGQLYDIATKPTELEKALYNTDPNKQAWAARVLTRYFSEEDHRRITKE